MEPSAERLIEVLTANGVDSALQQRLVDFFTKLQTNDEPSARIGHAFFAHVKDDETANLLWESQLKHVLRKAFRLAEAGELEAVEKDFRAALKPTAS